MDFNFNFPTKVIYGKNCVAQNAELFLQFGKNALIVTGKNGAKLSGALDDVCSALKSVGISFEIYDKIQENPLLSSCFEAGQKAKEVNAEFIIGIGGGSALDAAKAAAVFAKNTTKNKMDIYAPDFEKTALPIVAIGTTAGTGSEIGRVSVLTVDETGKKKSISGDSLFPKIAFCDPRYTNTMPLLTTYSTALDALSHAMEGYYSPKCSFVAEIFALKTAELIIPALKEIKNEQKVSHEIRQSLLVGSLCAGITLSVCGTAFPHQMGYILTENYGAPHGFACSAFLSEFANRASRFSKQKHEAFLAAAGVNHNELVQIIDELTILPQSISMTEEEIDDYCSRWEVTPPHFLCSPGEFSKQDAKNTLLKLFGGKNV